MATPETTLAIRLLCNRGSSNYGYWRAVTQELVGEPHDSGRLTDAWRTRYPVVRILAERLREEITADSRLLLCDFGLCRDLLNLAMDSVSWRRVAEALLDEHAEWQGWTAVEALLVKTE